MTITKSSFEKFSKQVKNLFILEVGLRGEVKLREAQTKYAVFNFIDVILKLQNNGKLSSLMMPATVRKNNV